jgi:hypothetical protein
MGDHLVEGYRQVLLLGNGQHHQCLLEHLAVDVMEVQN